MEPSLYGVLKVDQLADENTIRRAVSQARRLWSHRASSSPSMDDRHEAERMLALADDAEKTLLDPKARAAYNATLSTSPDLEPPSEGRRDSFSADGQGSGKTLRQILPGTWQVEFGSGSASDEAIFTLDLDGTCRVRGLKAPVYWLVTDRGEVKVWQPNDVAFYFEFSEMMNPNRLAGTVRRSGSRGLQRVVDTLTAQGQVRAHWIRI